VRFSLDEQGHNALHLRDQRLQRIDDNTDRNIRVRRLPVAGGDAARKS
jgi:hypothetical protein